MQRRPGPLGLGLRPGADRRMVQQPRKLPTRTVRPVHGEAIESRHAPIVPDRRGYRLSAGQTPSQRQISAFGTARDVVFLAPRLGPVRDHKLGRAFQSHANNLAFWDSKVVD